ncbi:MAG: prepilin-type N-terminal cleavage/methylation domain-containing protein [Pseudomonadota bacterium]
MLKRNLFFSSSQRGFTMVEALVAVAVLSFGLLAIGTFQARLVGESAYNKARAEALSLAQQKLDEMRSYSTAHKLVGNLLNAPVANPAPGSEYEYPVDVPTGETTYQDAAVIPGTNASFTRRWAVSRDATTDPDDLIDSTVSSVVVTVSWVDRSNTTQRVVLESDLAWKNPRGTADVAEITEPAVASPTGDAYLGDGSLSDTEMADLKTTNPETSNGDGTYSYDHDGDGDLELIVENADGSADVVLTLPSACSVEGGCTDFVKISGTVFFDRTGGSNLGNDDVYVLASDAAYCSRWIPTGVSGNTLNTSTDLTTLPNSDGDIYRDNNAVVDFSGNGTGTGDYEYFNYTCYLGGGWYGNIGLVMIGSNSQDYACVGDPDAGLVEAWKDVELAKRRVYRGLIHKYTTDANGDHVEVVDAYGETIFYSQGIKDAATLPDSTWSGHTVGHDYVLSRGNNPTVADCVAVLSNPDADPDADTTTANLFHSVPGDFICLNYDGDNDGVNDEGIALAGFAGYPWDYLNYFDPDEYDARLDCRYDPSDPPSTRYSIAGTITFDDSVAETWGSGDPTLGDFDGNINTTDGIDRCTIDSIVGNTLSYSCDYYVWTDSDNEETPWTGSVVVSSPTDIMCAPDTTAIPYVEANLSWESEYPFTTINSNLTGTDFTCKQLTDFTIEGTVIVDAGNDLSAETLLIEADAETASGCQWVFIGAETAAYSCSVLENSYTSGYTGDVRFTVPADHSITSAVSTNGAASVTGDVVTWSFSGLNLVPSTTPSSGNDVALDGPIDVYTIEGTVINGTPVPQSDILDGLSITISPDTGPGILDAHCNDPALNGTDVEYSCDVSVDTRLTNTWSGTGVINPRSGLWCGTDSAIASGNFSVTGDTTAPPVTCVVDTTEVVKVKVRVYAFTFASTESLTINMVGDGGSVSGTCDVPAGPYPLTLAYTEFTCTTDTVVSHNSTWSGHIEVTATDPIYDPTYVTTVCPVTFFGHPIYYVDKLPGSTHEALIGIDYLCSWSVYTDPVPNAAIYWGGWDGISTAVY